MHQTFYPTAHQAEFFKVLFPNLNGATIEVRCLGEPRNPEDERARQFFYRSVPQALNELPKTLAQQASFGIFIGVCPRSELDGSKGSVRQVYVLWADLDAKQFPGGKEEALAALRAFPLSCTLLVDSGHGYHAYWCLEEPVSVQTRTDLQSLEIYLRRLTQVLGGDPTGCELARVLRLPGTWNLKDPTHPVPVRILELTPERRYRLAEFDQILPPTDAVSGQFKANPPGWVPMLLHDLRKGDEDHCHRAFTKLIGKIQSDTLSPDDLFALLRPHLAQVTHNGHQFTEEKLRALIEDLSRRYPRHAPEPLDSKEPKWITAKQLCTQKAEAIAWVWEGYLAHGMTTLLSARPKVGKTTLLVHLLRALLRQEPFLGQSSHLDGKVLLFTEEPEALIRHRFLDRGLDDDELLVIRRFDVRRWADVLRQIELAIKQEHIALVIIDTLSPFWDVGDENDASHVTAALNPLQSLVQQHQVALLLIHHLRKTGGEEGTAHRGSGAILGAVDIGLELYRHTSATQRRLDILSRLQVGSVLIELTTTGYHFLGSPSTVKRTDLLQHIEPLLPDSEAEAKTYEELRQQVQPKPSETLIKNVVNALVAQRRVQQRGTGVRGDPFRFWKRTASESQAAAVQNPLEVWNGPTAP